MAKLGELTPAQIDAAKKAGGASALALAAALAISGVWEGNHTTPYKDPVGIWTVCRGETAVEMRKYTPAECDEIDRKRMIARLEEVRKVNPTIARTGPLQWASHASFANNIGIGAYRRSSVLRLYRAGRERDACLAMGKYKFAGGKVFQGLLLRRTGDVARLGEIELCLKDAKQ